MSEPLPYPAHLARQLVLDELFDLTLYRRLESHTTGALNQLLHTLVAVEAGHLKFWQEFFHDHTNRLTVGQNIKMIALVSAAIVFGDRGISLILESIEVNGIRKYLAVWDYYQDTPLGPATKKILEDELQHEDSIVAATLERRISGERIRNIFLGFNDGLVEILGSVSGFFAVFASSTSVIAAALTVSVAGAISMAAGVYVAGGSEKDVVATERRRSQFLGNKVSMKDDESPFMGGLIVGVSYFIGSLVPIIPVAFGAENVVLSAVISFVMIALVSLVLSFLSGMDIRRRIVINIVVIAIAVAATAVIGTIARVWLHLQL